MADLQAPIDERVNVLNPEGDLVSLQPHELPQALEAGYTHATPEQVENFANEQKYGTGMQQAATFAEGAGRGSTFGLAPKVEQMFGVRAEDIRKRQETNPVAAGAGEFTGLVGSAFVPGLEGSVAARAGELAAAKVLPEATSAIAKVGSAAVRGAVENAIVSGSDEVAKYMVQDPKQSLETAMTDIGLSALIGGGIGGAIGSVSPLWEATVGPKAQAFLQSVQDRANGITMPLREGIDEAVGASGIKLAPEMKAAFAENPQLRQRFNELRESGTASGDAVRKTLEDFKETLHADLQKAFGVEEGRSSAEIGDATKEKLRASVEEKNDAVRKQYDELNPTNEAIVIPDNSRLKFYDKLNEMGQKFGAADGPGEKIFREYSERILAQDTIQQLDKLMTEVGSKGTMARRAGDFETARAYQEIKEAVRDFQDRSIANAAKAAGRDGAEHAEALGRDIIKARKDARAKYAEMLDFIGDIAGLGKLGKVRSYGQFEEALEKIPSAKLAERLFDKKNIEGLGFLQKNFPEVMDMLASQKRADILAKGTTGKGNFNPNAIFGEIDKLPKEVKALVFKGDDLKKISGMRELLRAIPDRMNPSGTARTLDSLMKHMPAGAGVMASWLTGHNPIAGMLLGQAGKYLSRDAPDAAALSMLKFLGSAGPVDAGAWKAAGDLINKAYKGQRLIERTVKNVFRSGEEVLPQGMIPTEKETERLDRRVRELRKAPEKMLDVGGKAAQYMPEHGQAMGELAMNAVQFLDSQRPREPQLGILDAKAEIPKESQAQYTRALQIAEQPLIVLQHMKDGTLQPHDITTLQAIYPSLYGKLTQHLTEQMIEAKTKDEPIPYHMRMGLSLFMAQPLDSTMTPQAIQATQMALASPQAAPPQGSGMKGSMKALSDSFQTTETPGQSRERVRFS